MHASPVDLHGFPPQRVAAGRIDVHPVVLFAHGDASFVEHPAVQPAGEHLVAVVHAGRAEAGQPSFAPGGGDGTQRVVEYRAAVFLFQLPGQFAVASLSRPEAEPVEVVPLAAFQDEAGFVPDAPRVLRHPEVDRRGQCAAARLPQAGADGVGRAVVAVFPRYVQHRVPQVAEVDHVVFVPFLPGIAVFHVLLHESLRHLPDGDGVVLRPRGSGKGGQRGKEEDEAGEFHG